MPSPAPGQVRVRVAATSLNLSDWECLRGAPAYARIGGLRAPARRTPGSDIAGVVDDIGEGVTTFRPGDEVYADKLALMGGFAEYAPAEGQAPSRSSPPSDSARTSPASTTAPRWTSRGRSARTK